MIHYSVVMSMIDEIYKKERKYVTNFDRDNMLTSHSPIFEL